MDAFAVPEDVDGSHRSQTGGGEMLGMSTRRTEDRGKEVEGAMRFLSRRHCRCSRYRRGG